MPFQGFFQAALSASMYFFVISGYLISGHVFTSLSENKFSFLTFYQRRIRRIFPTLILVLVACLVFGWFALLATEYAQLGKHTAASAPFLVNLAFWREAGYFDNSGITKPLLHLWSLGVEEQFYIVWPVAAWAIWRFRVNVLGAMLLLGALSFSHNLVVTVTDPTAAFYSPFTRFWELLIGAALAQAERRGVLPPPIAIRFLGLAGALLLAVGFVMISDASPFPGIAAAVPVVGTALIIMAGPTSFLNRVVLSAKLPVGLGLISYPLYLWHWPLLSFAYIVNSGTPKYPMLLGLVAGSVALAILTFWVVERPIRSGRWQRAAISLPLCALMVLLAVAGAAIFVSKGFPDRPAALTTSKLDSQFVGALWPYATNKQCLSRYPYSEVSEIGWWFCMLEKDEPATILVTGGSFANQLYPGLANNLALADQNVLSIGTCSPLYVAPDFEYGPKTGTPCTGSNWAHQHAFIDNILQNEPSIRTVIVDGLRSGSVPVDVDRVVDRLKQLGQFGAQVIVFLPHYRSNVDIRGCFPRPLVGPRVSCDIPQEEYDLLIAANRVLERQIKEKLPEVLFFEQNSVFCSGGRCSIVSNGFPMIRDEWRHISEYASDLVAAAFVDWAKISYPAILQRGTE